MHRSNIRWHEGNEYECLSFPFIFTCAQVMSCTPTRARASDTKLLHDVSFRVRFVENSSFTFSKATSWFCYCIVNKAQMLLFFKSVSPKISRIGRQNKSEITDFFLFGQKNPFGELFSEMTSKRSISFFFLQNAQNLNTLRALWPNF